MATTAGTQRHLNITSSTLDASGNVLSGGNVGIGTTSPSNATHIYKNASLGSPTSPTLANAGLRIQDNSNSMYFDGNSIVSVGAGNLEIGAATSSMLLITNGAERMRIDSAGDVTIRSGKKLIINRADNATGGEITYGPTGTGFIFNDANGDGIDFKLGSTMLMSIDSANQRVGIGTSSPSAKLQVAGDILSTGDITIDNSSGDPFLKLKTTAQQYVLRIDQSDGEKFQIRDITNSLTPFTINSSGNVGIGTTSPSAKLGVAGNIKLEDGTQRNIIGPTNESLGIFANPNGSDEGILFSTDNGTTTEMIILNGGNVGIGTSSPGAKLDVSGVTNESIRLSTSYSSDRSARAGIKWRDATNETAGIWTEYDGSEVSINFGNLYNSGYQTNTSMIIRGTGNVGIGTTSPAVSLDISATDAVQMPSGTTTERGNITSPANGMLRYNSSDNEFEGYIDGNWGSIGGGSSSGNTTVVVDNFSGDNSDTTFNITNTIANEDNVQIYIDGVYQSKSNYSTSGATITFSTAPPSGTNNIEVTHFVQINGAPSIEVDTFNGNASTTVFTLTTAPATKNNLQIYIDGVYQAKVNYSVSGTTLTFTTAPATGTNNIEVTHLKIS